MNAPDPWPEFSEVFADGLAAVPLTLRLCVYLGADPWGQDGNTSETGEPA